MIELRLGAPAGRLRALFLGAHCDDIEIGCGGTMLKLARRHPRLSAHWVVLSANAERAKEAEVSAARFLGGAAPTELIIERFRDGYLPYEGARVKDFFEGLARIDPDVIFTHHRDDAHQDHRLVSELTWNTFRDHLILEYEIPKYDGDTGAPNAFVPLDDATAEAKVRHVMDTYASQAVRPWFTPDTLLATMRLRGVQARARYAEGFYARKLVLG